LSGFLITALLVKERQEFGSFSLKNFWIRRSLRIWPLYYLALIMGFFIIPFIHTHIFGITPPNININLILKEQTPFYFTLLGNWAVVLYNYPPFTNIAHLWTISLEEQFYLLWPLVLFFTKNFKKSFIAGLILILLAMAFRFYLALHGVRHPGIYVDTFARMDTLVLGSLAALVFCYHPEYIDKIKGIFNLPLQLLALTFLFILLYKIFLFDPTLTKNVVFGYSLFGILMLYFCLSSLQTWTHFSHFLTFEPFVYLGKISYGLYVWHILALETTAMVFPQFLKPLVGLGLTIFLGFVSYRFYESKFLKLKTKFSRIASRPV